jgi:hypothetical protein
MQNVVDEYRCRHREVWGSVLRRTWLVVEILRYANNLAKQLLIHL